MKIATKDCHAYRLAIFIRYPHHDKRNVPCHMSVSEAIPPLRDYLHNRDRHVAIAPRDDRIATSFIP
jgi:hypothetical protein